MSRDRDYYSLLKEIKEVKDLLSEVLRRLGSMEYSGFVEYGEPNHISNNHSGYLHLKLKRNEKEKNDKWNNILHNMCVCYIWIKQITTQGYIPKTTMEIHKWGGWARIHNRGIMIYGVNEWNQKDN